MGPLLTGATALTLLLLVPFIGRAIAGPTIFDRVVALNGMGTLVPVLLVLIGLRYDREDMFVDMALALFLLNLFMTLLMARYVRDKVAEGR
jgi:multicomponent Na+:H+ antiporter subunit F